MNASTIQNASWNAIPFDIAETILQSCSDFASMRALVLTSRVFHEVLQRLPNSTLSAIAHRRFKPRAFDLLDMWRPGGLSEVVRSCLQSYTEQRPKLGKEDSSLSPIKGHIGVPEIRRLYADENDICFLSAYFLSVYVDAAEIGSFSRRYLSRNGYPTHHHPRLDLIRNIARHPDRPINGYALFDLFREEMVFFDKERGIEKPRTFQEILEGYYAAIALAQYFIPVEQADPESSILPKKGCYDHRFHRNLSSQELVGLHYIGGHDVEGNLLDVSAMKQDFAPSFGCYVLDWTQDNIEKYAKYIQQSSNDSSHDPDKECRLVEKNINIPNASSGELAKALVRKTGVKDTPIVAFTISYRDFHASKQTS